MGSSREGLCVALRVVPGVGRDVKKSPWGRVTVSLVTVRFLSCLADARACTCRCASRACTPCESIMTTGCPSLGIVMHTSRSAITLRALRPTCLPLVQSNAATGAFRGQRTTHAFRRLELFGGLPRGSISRFGIRMRSLPASAYNTSSVHAMA